MEVEYLWKEKVTRGKQKKTEKALQSSGTCFKLHFARTSKTLKTNENFLSADEFEYIFLTFTIFYWRDEVSEEITAEVRVKAAHSC